MKSTISTSAIKSFIKVIFLFISPFVVSGQFITTWDVGSNLSITIPTAAGSTYDYHVDWDNDGIIDDSNVTGNITHVYPANTSTVTIQITGLFPRINFDGSPDKDKILSVDQWGNNPWTSMVSAFFNCDNLNINAIDAPNLSNVTNLSSMFNNCATVNASLDHWDVSNVSNFSTMFRATDSFDGNITNWNVSNATTMALMFGSATAFNQDISGWDVSSVTNFTLMFDNATAMDHNLGMWNIGGASTHNGMFDDAGFSITNYDNMLAGWQNQGLSGISVGAAGLNYCNGKNARDGLIANGWAFAGDAEFCGTNDFVTTWNTELNGSSNNNQITIPELSSATYLYDVDWDNDGNYDEYGITGAVTHAFASSGIKTIRIKGDFPRIFFAGPGDALKLLSVDQWGTIVWESMAFSFSGCQNMNITALDAPDLSESTSMASMLRSCSSLTASINHWDVSNITNFSSCFRFSTNFNSDLSNWDVSNATIMSHIFNTASSFDQDISGWDVQNVTTFESMFQNASNMDQDLSSWNINNSNNIVNMLENSGFSATNYDNMLISWLENVPPSGLSLGAANLEYCNSEIARGSLITAYGWTIAGDSKYCTGSESSDPIPLDINRSCEIENYNYIGFDDSGHSPAPICGSGTEDMWFTCVVPASSLIILDFQVQDNHIVSVYKNSTTGGLLGCYEIGPGNTIAYEEDMVAAGDDLFIQVYRTTSENELGICAYDPQLLCTTPIFPANGQYVTGGFAWGHTDTISADSYNVYYGRNEPLDFLGSSSTTGLAMPVDSTRDEGLWFWKALPVRDGIESNNCPNNSFYNTATSPSPMVCARAVNLKIDATTCNYMIAPSDVSDQAAIILISGIPESAIIGNGTASVLIDANEVPQSFTNPLTIDSYSGSGTEGRGCITEGYLFGTANCGTFGVDNDGDGVPFYEDNCPDNANVDQLDSDGDGVGDVCDNCPFASNQSQSDYDENGIGDVCDMIGNLQTSNNVGVGVSDPHFKLEIGGSLFINADPSSGALILKSADGSCWRMVATDNGSLNLVKTDCVE